MHSVVLTIFRFVYPQIRTDVALLRLLEEENFSNLYQFSSAARCLTASKLTLTA